MELGALIDAAVDRRREWADAQEAAGTTAWRWFHGATEGALGLSIDRYGDQVLVQSFREVPDEATVSALAVALDRLEVPVADRVWRVRDRERTVVWAGAGAETRVASEQGDRFHSRLVHRGLDPWFFLDFRPVRRWLRGHAPDKSVLNLFSYTGTAAVAAARAGASEVWNVDFGRWALEVGQQNAALNDVADRIGHHQENVIPAVRQLGGLTVKGRGARRQFTRFEPRPFDIVVLDPPTFARTPFGAVDIVHDYPSLLKPALLATKPGGTVVATHHASSQSFEEWLDNCLRCAAKAGMEVRAERLPLDLDFPSPDGESPLKIVLLRVVGRL